MSSSDTLTTLFSHNLWANLRILEVCSELSDVQLDSSIMGTYGSIRETLRHIVRAEQSYFARISTGQPYQRHKDEQPMDLAEMTESVRTTGAGFIEWAPKVKAEDAINVDWDGTPRDVPKTIILTQVINHATEHRAQIMAILTQIGVQPPDLDSWTFFDESDE
jgi:uncharacterized damage-inducible protein DinB